MIIRCLFSYKFIEYISVILSEYEHKKIITEKLTANDRLVINNSCTFDTRYEDKFNPTTCKWGLVVDVGFDLYVYLFVPSPQFYLSTV